MPVSDTGLSGQSVVLDGVLETPFVIESNTATTLTTTGAVDMTTIGRVGSTFQGALVLRSLQVRGGATFGSGGDIILIFGGEFTVAPDSRVDGEVVVR